MQLRREIIDLIDKQVSLLNYDLNREQLNIGIWLNNEGQEKFLRCTYSDLNNMVNELEDENSFNEFELNCLRSTNIHNSFDVRLEHANLKTEFYDIYLYTPRKTYTYKIRI